MPTLSFLWGEEIARVRATCRSSGTVRRAPGQLPPIREFNDRGTLWLLEDPLNLRDLLQILEPELIVDLDFGRARRENRTFIPADLQKQESDVVFLVPWRGEPGREVWVYVLLEHQSGHEPLMSLRLYLYMGQLWEVQWREWEDRRMPAEQRRLRPIIPVVFYTGAKWWGTPLGLRHLMELPADLERFAPTWETPFLNLHGTSPEALTRFASAVGWALRVMQAERVEPPSVVVMRPSPVRALGPPSDGAAAEPPPGAPGARGS